MQSKCATQVRAAAGGRQISDAKLQAIDDAITANMQQLAKRDPTAWQAMPKEQRIAAAVAKAMEDIQAEAGLKEYRAGLRVLRAADTDARALQQQDLGNNVTRWQGLARDMQNVENEIHGVRNDAVAHMGELFDAGANRDGTGLLRNLGMKVFGLDNPQMTADVVREVFKQVDFHTGNKAAKEAAKAWLETVESMRQWFNKAGGDIGKLGYGNLTQAHDHLRVRAAGPDGWAAKTLTLLDREQYVRADGSLMDDVEVTAPLRSAHEMISTQGITSTWPASSNAAAHGRTAAPTTACCTSRTATPGWRT